MDNQQSFRHQADYGVDDAAIDAPPVIGTDERRMHVRAYNYWVSQLHGQDFPSIEDLDPESLQDFGPHSVLLDFTSGADKPTIAYIGDKLRAECDLEEAINHVSEVPSRTLLSRLTDHFLQIIANRAPVGFEAEFVNQRGMETAYRGILMPFSSDHDTIDFIYGVINWKEVVSGDLAQKLGNEVEQMLAQAPVPAVTHAPVWADAPSHDDVQAEVEVEAYSYDASDEHDNDVLGHFAPTDDDELGDWLAAAREAADVARTIESRGRVSLYRAIGLAYDFALIADERPEDYAELLDHSGLVAQERAPMTPIVKLVFGGDYDKTRVAEYAAALSYAKAQHIPAGTLAERLAQFHGGLKGLLKDARADRRPMKLAVPRVNTSRERARAMIPQALFAVSGDDEFVVLVARRVDGEHVGVIGVAELDEALIDRALQRLAL